MPFVSSLGGAMGYGRAFKSAATPTGLAKWATSIGSITNAEVKSVAIDSSSNVYIIGYFSGTATIRSFGSGGGGGAITLTPYGTLTSASVFEEVFIVKYNTTGIAQWATTVGSAGTSEYGYSIAVDTSGNVYVTGNFSTTTRINSFSSGGGGGAITLTSYGRLVNASGNIYAFIAKYNTNGIVQWATSIESLNVANGYSLAVDTTGNVYVCAYVIDTLTIKSFGSGGGGGTITLSSYGTFTPTSIDNALIVKYNSSGIVQWATTIETVCNNVNYSIALDSLGNVYITSQFSNSALINNFTSGGGGGPITLTAYRTLTTGGNNVYIVKYNSSGIAQWATCIAAASSFVEVNRCIATDSSNNVYFTGFFGSTATIKNFVSDTGGTITLESYGTLITTGSDNAFVVKYNSSGTAQWATTIESTGEDFGTSVVVDASGNVYVTGSFSGTATINNLGTGGGGGPISFTSYGTLTSDGGNNPFIVQYGQ